MAPRSTRRAALAALLSAPLLAAASPFDLELIADGAPALAGPEGAPTLGLARLGSVSIAVEAAASERVWLLLGLPVAPGALELDPAAAVALPLPRVGADSLFALQLAVPGGLPLGLELVARPLAVDDRTGAQRLGPPARLEVVDAFAFEFESAAQGWSGAQANGALALVDGRAERAFTGYAPEAELGVEVAATPGAVAGPHAASSGAADGWITAPLIANEGRLRGALAARADEHGALRLALVARGAAEVDAVDVVVRAAR